MCNSSRLRRMLATGTSSCVRALRLVRRRSGMCPAQRTAAWWVMCVCSGRKCRALRPTDSRRLERSSPAGSRWTFGTRCNRSWSDLRPVADRLPGPRGSLASSAIRPWGRPRNAPVPQDEASSPLLHARSGCRSKTVTAADADLVARCAWLSFCTRYSSTSSRSADSATHHFDGECQEYEVPNMFRRMRTLSGSPSRVALTSANPGPSPGHLCW